MGNSILSGLAWGSVTSVLVLGAVSLIAPQPAPVAIEEAEADALDTVVLPGPAGQGAPPEEERIVALPGPAAVPGQTPGPDTAALPGPVGQTPVAPSALPGPAGKTIAATGDLPGPAGPIQTVTADLPGPSRATDGRAARSLAALPGPTGGPALLAAELLAPVTEAGMLAASDSTTSALAAGKTAVTETPLSPAQNAPRIDTSDLEAIVADVVADVVAEAAGDPAAIAPLSDAGSVIAAQDLPRLVPQAAPAIGAAGSAPASLAATDAPGAPVTGQQIEIAVETALSLRAPAPTVDAQAGAVGIGSRDTAPVRRVEPDLRAPGPVTSPDAVLAQAVIPAPTPRPAPSPAPAPPESAQPDLSALPGPSGVIAPVPAPAPAAPQLPRGLTQRVAPLTERAQAEAGGVRVNRLPTVVAPASPAPQGVVAEPVDEAPEVDSADTPATARLPGSGSVGVIVGGTPAVATTQNATTPALVRNAAPFVPVPGEPLMALVLRDPGDATDRLANIGGPLTVALDPTGPGATQAADAYRAAGHEVILYGAGLPEGATPQDAEVTLAAHFAQLPGAIGLMETEDGSFTSDRRVLGQVLEILGGDGHGLLLWDRGLNPALSAAGRVGQPTAQVFRRIDGPDLSASAVARRLDRAAFEAGRDGAVVVFGDASEATLAALASWLVTDRAGQVTLAPVSALMQGE